MCIRDSYYIDHSEETISWIVKKAIEAGTEPKAYMTRDNTVAYDDGCLLYTSRAHASTATTRMANRVVNRMPERRMSSPVATSTLIKPIN